MTTDAPLPARDLATIQLARWFGEPGCPMCRHRQDALRRAVEAFLYESVNDVAFRAALDAARGFCAEHLRLMVAVERRNAGGRLGSAILLDAIMRVRIDELRSVRRAGPIVRGRRAQAAMRPAACQVCALATTTDTVTGTMLVRQSADPAWAEAIATAELCLGHLTLLMGVGDRPSAWAAVEERQLTRVEALRSLVVDFAYHASHDRRHLTTPEELEAPVRAAAFVAGEPDDGAG